MKLTDNVLRSFRVAKVFRENSDKINCFDFSTNGETIISSSDDDSLVLYDCQEGKHYPVPLPSRQQIHPLLSWAQQKGLMHLQGKPVCSFDPEGLIFAAGINSEMVKLYDLRSFDKGPFATFKLQYDRTCEWTGIKFSNDGKLILLSTNGAALRILDAFKGVVLHSFGGYNNSKGVTLEASFTPDSQFVMIGSEDGKIHVWNAESGMKVALLDGKHTGPICCLQFNPKYMTFASACSNMVSMTARSGFGFTWVLL
ncbi:unnamed protein product [Tetraodon nigroviridis]|uniref:Chromosome 11 SCAF14979, whole genome shotgun sequence n=1 Tax=Tetraodon nigroviridis TaxID=99883 RepID=Q4RX76_TETNG|nr:unnamed protein product [Tetraodon nigroviridis]